MNGNADNGNFTNRKPLVLQAIAMMKELSKKVSSTIVRRLLWLDDSRKM